MKIFLSWSGNRSKAVAEALESWLRRVIQAVDPWLSSEMTKGIRWSTEVAARLEESRVGIFCLTADNLKEPWILFEAGAISKTKDAYVCTILLDIKPSDVEPPLGQFQHTSVSKPDMLRLVRSINAAAARPKGCLISSAMRSPKAGTGMINPKYAQANCLLVDCAAKTHASWLHPPTTLDRQLKAENDSTWSE